MGSDRPMRTTGHTLQDQGSTILLKVGVRPLALGTNDVHIHVLVDAVCDPGLHEATLEDDPAALHVSGSAEFLEEVGEQVLVLPLEGVADVLEVPEDGELSLIDDLCLRYLEPLVVGDIVRKVVPGPLQEGLVIRFCGHW